MSNKKERMRLLFLCMILHCLVIPTLFAKDKIIVVIDPGHGGGDHGHISVNKEYLPEKELNLRIALKFGEMLEKQLDNIQIIYSRTDDSFPSLNDRVKLANESKADYFISIHCNANGKKTVYGTETHVHTMKAPKAVGLAQAFEKEFISFAGRYSRGVKDSEDREHSLQVLKYTTMTGVLIECGFLTNDDEALFLNTQMGQEKLAISLFRAFKSFVVKQHPTISFLKEEPRRMLAIQQTDSAKKYAIQIMSSKQPVETSNPEFKKIEFTVSRNEIRTQSVFRYRYMVGEYASINEAIKDLEKVQQNGFKDAYIVKLN
jgi:N-acetylmuramoyl-L-alanine amidase